MQCCRSQKKCNFGRNNTLYTIHSQRLLTRLKRWWRGSFPPPVRHARQKMKAFRTCLHSQLSVSSTQAGVDQIRGEFGWTVVLRREKGAVLKEILWGRWESVTAAKKMTHQTLAWHERPVWPLKQILTWLKPTMFDFFRSEIKSTDLLSKPNELKISLKTEFDPRWSYFKAFTVIY